MQNLKGSLMWWYVSRHYSYLKKVKTSTYIANTSTKKANILSNVTYITVKSASYGKDVSPFAGKKKVCRQVLEILDTLIWRPLKKKTKNKNKKHLIFAWVWPGSGVSYIIRDTFLEFKYTLTQKSQVKVKGRFCHKSDMNHKYSRTHPTYTFKIRQGETHYISSMRIIYYCITHTTFLFRRWTTCNV